MLDLKAVMDVVGPKANELRDIERKINEVDSLRAVLNENSFGVGVYYLGPEINNSGFNLQRALQGVDLRPAVYPLIQRRVDELCAEIEAAAVKWQ